MSTEQSCQNARDAAQAAVPVRRWLWRSYVRAAIIPLLVVELSFLAIYWVSNLIVHQQNVESIGTVSQQFLADVSQREAAGIGHELSGYAAQTRLFASETRRALNSTFVPVAAERARYAFDRDGSIYTTRDTGTTASFYSNVTHPGPAQLQRMLRLGAIDPFMAELTRTNSGVLSVYFNSAGSYNRIYPYIDAATQYPRNMNIPSYNFYYQADARHNPERKPVWTDAYVDPAGHGWMISCIAPVWNGNRLEGVVGMDIGLETIIGRLMQMDLPWGAYALLVDRTGRIIAMPPQGEGDLRLQELTSHHYSEAISKDSFKPEVFDINRRSDTRPLADAMRKAQSGHAVLHFDGPHHASFATVPGLGWRLVVIAPADAINAAADTLRASLQQVGYAMMGGLLLFYIMFFFALYRRSQAMSRDVARPLDEIAALIDRIGHGEHRQAFQGAVVAEFDLLGRQLVETGQQLGDAHDRIVEQELVVRQALAQEEQINQQRTRLVQIMSHELRTPLALIDSGAQILDRKADVLCGDDLRRRSARMRVAVKRITDLLDKLILSLTLEAVTRGPVELQCGPVSLMEVIGQAIAHVPTARLNPEIADDLVALADAGTVRSALDAVIDNALRYSKGAGVAVRLMREDAMATIEVEDRGPPLGEEELADIGKLFFRGSNAAGSAGAGVSLHLARKQIEERGGRLELKRGQGGGFLARIALPLAGEGALP